MRCEKPLAALAAVSAAVLMSLALQAESPRAAERLQLGPRPLALVRGMEPSPLRTRLLGCARKPPRRTEFAIAHRGAPARFPEHTRESYEAAARMGAGFVECDVTFTRDGELVCRHSECDLHETTNILETPLSKRCSVPGGRDAAPRCCTSDLTLAEFRTLVGKRDAAHPTAASPVPFIDERVWRGAPPSDRGTLLTLRESLALNERLGVKHVPELKSGDPARIRATFAGQAGYAQKLVDELRQARVEPKRVWLQSFEREDILYWITHAPEYGAQAVYLDDVDPSSGRTRLTTEDLRELRSQGVRILAPPMPALLAVDPSGAIGPSRYAEDIRAAGLDIITWTFERSDLRNGAASAGPYYAFDPAGRAVRKESDMYEVLDVLARDVLILGIFSDWPATVTYYANCMQLD